MKLIIDIPDRLIKKVKDHYVNPYEVDEICEAILDGTPLPEHHGGLIDVNVLRNNIHYVPLAPIFQGDYVTYRNVIFADILDMLPIAIEEDSE